MTAEPGCKHRLEPLLYRDLVRQTLLEDLGQAGDITTDAVVPGDLMAVGSLKAREAGRVCGMQIAKEAFRHLDPGVQLERLVVDGSDVEAGAQLARLEGRASALLTAERTALNFLAHLSGIATATRDWVRLAAGHRARVVCTRKTTPGLRCLEKYAVRVGGGANHRFGLDDAVLIKDNHLALAGSVAEAVRRVRAASGHMVKVEVEVDSLDQLREALAVGVDAVLLDNMRGERLVEAVRLAQQRGVVSEASGGVSREALREIAATGVDLISAGWLTHSAPALDVALDLELSDVASLPS